MTIKQKPKTSATENTTFVYDAAGKLVEEYSGSTLQTSYLYAGSQLLATETATDTNYTATDQLGSPRVVTDQNGNVVSRRDFLPFGEEIFADGTIRTTANKYSLTGQDAVRQRFTGYQRDLETGLDFAEARYYNNSQGRFTAVDPLMASAKAANPQTMNRYGYALNNLYRMTDPSGMDVSGLDEQTDMAFQQLNELVDHAYEVKQAELDKAREEAEKRKIAQASVLHESLNQQTGPDNHQQGEAPQDDSNSDSGPVTAAGGTLNFGGTTFNGEVNPFGNVDFNIDLSRLSEQQRKDMLEEGKGFTVQVGLRLGSDKVTPIASAFPESKEVGRPANEAEGRPAKMVIEKRHDNNTSIVNAGNGDKSNVRTLNDGALSFSGTYAGKTTANFSGQFRPNPSTSKSSTFRMIIKTQRPDQWGRETTLISVNLRLLNVQPK